MIYREILSVANQLLTLENVQYNNTFTGKFVGKTESIVQLPQYKLLSGNILYDGDERGLKYFPSLSDALVSSG